MIVVMAEKPNMGKDIARVLGATKDKGKYWEGNGYKVTWAFGHLMELIKPEEYKEWTSEADLPFIPNKFIRKVKDGKKDQFNTIGELFMADDTEYIVNATDADREGQAIFGYIYEKLGCTKKVMRLWITSLTETAIKEGFASLKPDAEYANLLASARCRQEADWLIGMNCSMAIKNGTIGRVQTPTLRLVTEAFIAHRDFKPTPYWQVRVQMDFEGSSFFGVFQDQFMDKEEAGSFLGKVPGFLTVDDKVNQEVVETPPLPFDLTSLQAEANRRFSLKAQRTLDIAQELYDKYKVTTYPRTNSRYLGKDMKDRVSRNIASLKQLNYSTEFLKAVEGINAANINTNIFREDVGASHHAIIPTFEHLDVKFETADHKKVFELIINQFVMSLMAPCKKEKLEYKFTCEGKKMNVVGMTILEPGWRALYKGDAKKKDTDEEEKQNLPKNLGKNDLVTVTDRKLLEKQKKAPSLLTEASLLKAMESAGKYIEDDVELSKAIKNCGLGTPATRAGIIERLFDKKYICNEGNYLIPTQLGMDLYNKVKTLPVSSVKLTGEFESKLNKMSEGEYQSVTFNGEIREFTAEMTGLCSQISLTKAKESVGKCPVCGKDVYEGKNAYYCSDWSKDNPNCCKFGFTKNFFNKTITTAIARQLLTEGKTSVIKGFEYEGRKFDKALVLDPETKRLSLMKAEKKVVEGCKCPICGSDIIELEHGFMCKNFSKEENVGCKYYQKKALAQKEVLTADLLKSLLSGETSKEFKGFLKKDGKTFSARLRFDKEKSDIVFVFDEDKTADFICPECGGVVRYSDKVIYCENSKSKDETKEKCKFFVFREVCRKKISQDIIKELVVKGETESVINGFTASSGKTFSARLAFTKENPERPYNITFIFDNKKKE